MAVVYRHIRLDKNEPFYIGIGKTERRATQKIGRNRYWKNIVSTTEYEVEILFEDLTWEKACEKEIELIQLYGRKDLGLGSLVNMTNGGEGGLGIIPSKETRLKMSKSLKGKIRSDESKKLYSLIAKNRTYSEETIKKFRDAKKGKKLSIEHIENMRGKVPWNKGKKLSNETRKKISDSKIGNKNALGCKFWLGKLHSDESKEKMKKPKSEETKQKMRQAWIKRKEKQNNG